MVAGGNTVVQRQKYVFKARNASGRIVNGTIYAENEDKAREILQSRWFFVVDLKTPSVTSREIQLFTPRVGIKELAIFCRQFATMVQSGVPMLTSLNILTQQSENSTLKKALQTITQSLETGKSLSEAFKDHPKIFPHIFISMIEAGEAGGALEQTLERLANHFEKEEYIRSKVKSAMTYPVVVMVVAILAVIVILTAVLPTFIKMLNDLNVALPLPTRIVIGISGFLQQYWYILLGIIGICIFAFKKFKATEKGNRVIDAMILQIPVFGLLIRKMIITRFSRTLATLLHSGVPLLQALDIVKNVADNAVVIDAIKKSENSIKEGQGLSLPLEKSQVFPPMVTKMMAIGEDTGALDDLLEKIAIFYEREVDDAVASLSSALEPMILVFMGGVVGFILMSVFLPMFTATTSIQ